MLSGGGFGRCEINARFCKRRCGSLVSTLCGGAGCDVWLCEGQGARAFFSHIPESITFCFKHCCRHLCIPSVSCIRWRRGVHVRSRSATLCFRTRDVPDENGRCFAQRACLLDVNSLIRSTVALPCEHVSREQVGWRVVVVMCAWCMCVRVCVSAAWVWWVGECGGGGGCPCVCAYVCACV